MSNSPYIAWFDSQLEQSLQLLKTWSAINSWTGNLDGLFTMLLALENAFSKLGGESMVIPLNPSTRLSDQYAMERTTFGNALSIKKRPKSKFQILFGGHMDTVFPTDTPFKQVIQIDNHKLRGPGVADMKGGLLVLLIALEAYEHFTDTDELGWEVLITPDEEAGSIGSQHLWIERASQYDVGLIFEPAFPDGALAGARKGSANYTILATGKAAHAGRDFHSGKNAIKALAHFIIEACQIAEKFDDMTLNVGVIKGGVAANIVPDQALCRLNIRMQNAADLNSIRDQLLLLAERISLKHSVKMELHVDAERFPKPFDERTKHLFDALQASAGNQGLSLTHRISGGVCDGNLLAAAGLPVIDSLGVVGGNLHTHEEYMLIRSLLERAKVVCDFLIHFSHGEFPSLLRSHR